jgi:hypothetical protein
VLKPNAINPNVIDLNVNGIRVKELMKQVLTVRPLFNDRCGNFSGRSGNMKVFLRVGYFGIQPMLHTHVIIHVIAMVGRRICKHFVIYYHTILPVPVDHGGRAV